MIKCGIMSFIKWRYKNFMQHNDKNKTDKSSKIVLILIIILVILTSIGFFIYNNKNVEPVSGGKLMMSTLVTQSIYDKNTTHAQNILDQSFDELGWFENSFSMYIDDSEISMINKNAGKGLVPVSDSTYKFLKKCVKYCEISDGKFDITIAPVTIAWAVNSENPQIPPQETLDELLKLVNYKNIIFDDKTKTVGLSEPGMMIDLGAIAKGAACDIVSDLYKANNLQGGLLSVGGNVLAIGYPSKSKNFFSVGIRNPRGEANDLLGVLKITDKIISTSGDYERYFMDGDTRYHHIFDTSTAYPSQTDLISVSIITDNGAYAEFLSTYLFVMGKDYVSDIVNNKTNLDYDIIAVDNELNVYISKNIIDIFEPNEKLTDFNFIGVNDFTGNVYE